MFRLGRAMRGAAGVAAIGLAAAVLAGFALGRPAPQVADAATPASQTISFGALASKTYGDAAFNVSATASSGLAVSFAASGKCTVAGSLVTLTGAGLCTITASQAGTAAFKPATPVSRWFNTARKALTITANNKTRPYGTANPPFDATYSGFVSPEDQTTAGVLSGALSCTAATGALSPAGAYTIFCSGQTAANYSITYRTGTLTITKIGQTITFGGIPGKVYGAASFTVGPTASSGLFVTLTATGPCTVPSGSFFGPVTITGVGLCTVTANQGGNGNYNAAAPQAAAFTITPAPLTIAADNKWILQGQPAGTLTFHYSGFVNGDSQFRAGVITTEPVCAAAGGPPYAPGGHAITCSGAVVAPNYSPITYVPGTLTVISFP